MLDMIIANGTLVNADKSIHADMAVKDGKIVAIGDQHYFPSATRVIDATGKLVQKFLNKWTIFLFCSILFSSNQKEH